MDLLRFTLQFVRHLSLTLALVALGSQLALALEPQLAIKGGSKSLRDNIQHYLSILDESCKAPIWRLRALMANTQSEVEAAGQALGYYDMEFETHLNPGEKCWSLGIDLTPGDPVRVSDLRLEVLGAGADDSIFKPLFAKPGIAKGDRLNHDKYEKLKARFGGLAAAHGYFDGKFELARVEVNRREKSALITLIFNTGPRYKIGAIRIKHDILSEDFLERYLNIHTGDDYDAEKLLDLKNDFNGSNYFSSAIASPNLQELDSGQVPIDVNLETRKRRAYSVGAGVETDTGPRILLGYEDRYITDSGHRLNADLSAAEKNTTFELAYTIPLAKPAREFLKLYTGYEREQADTLETRKNTLGTSYSVYQDNRWLRTYALNYERERSYIGDAPGFDTQLLIPSLTFTRTQTDGNPYTQLGWSVIAKFSGSPESLGSDYSFVQFYARAKYVKGFEFGRILWRTELGSTKTEDLENLPASVRFFAGGDQSVRGYSYKSLGPKFEGEVTGGSNLLVNSLELDHRLDGSNWVIAAFVDAGNASNTTNFDFAYGTGLGVRWISPIGPVRVDVAKALDGDKGWALHISMGPDL